MDEILKIVDQAIDIANLVKSREPERFDSAMASLFELAAELRNSAPEHPALDRLNEYINQHSG